MALTVTHENPIVVTGTTSASAAIETGGTWYIVGVYWLNPTNSGHKLALQDGNGKELFEFYCQTGNSSQDKTWPNGAELIAKNGIYCDDMDSGTLYIYVK
jgi:hypothetical protein